MPNRAVSGLLISGRKSGPTRRAHALAVHRKVSGTPGNSQNHDETGSSLILALVFLARGKPHHRRAAYLDGNELECGRGVQ